jgi:hypothetical protein
VSMKMGVFWDVAPCSLADIDRDDKGSKLLWNVSQDYTVIHTRRQPSLCHRDLWRLKITLAVISRL